MNNETILNKLVELGYGEYFNSIDNVSKFYLFKIEGEKIYCFPSDSKRNLFVDSSNYFCILQDALVSECDKHGYFLKIGNGLRVYKYDGCNCEHHYSLLFKIPQYSHQAVIEAFCKVTNINLNEEKL